MKATIPFRFNMMNTCDVYMVMGKKRQTKNDAGHTVGGTPATVAIRSQTTPLGSGNKVSELRHCKMGPPDPTCFQRRRPRANDPPPSWRRRSSPMSTIRSKTMSVMRVTMILGLFFSVLSTIQSCRTGSHAERVCRWVSLDDPKLLRQPRLFTCTIPDTNHISMGFGNVCKMREGC
jgi:hypothetical protein